MKTHYTMITETCSCGAKMEIETPSPTEGFELLAQWRTKHLHYSAQHYPVYPYRYYYPSWGYPYVTSGTSGTFTAYNGGENPPLSSVS